MVQTMYTNVSKCKNDKIKGEKKKKKKNQYILLVEKLGK
jgi:hypothetical protein